MADPITWADFERCQIRVGTIVSAEPFPEARKPAWRLVVDFGPHGTRRSSAQLTHLYTPETLVGRQVIAVLGFPPRRIGPFVSECLVTGFVREDGAVVLAVPDQPVPDGSPLA